MCQTRMSSVCTPTCSSSLCGDGVLDEDGVNDILDDNDDELCDD